MSHANNAAVPSQKSSHAWHPMPTLRSTQQQQRQQTQQAPVPAWGCQARHASRRWQRLELRGAAASACWRQAATPHAALVLLGPTPVPQVLRPSCCWRIVSQLAHARAQQRAHVSPGRDVHELANPAATCKGGLALSTSTQQRQWAHARCGACPQAENGMRGAPLLADVAPDASNTREFWVTPNALQQAAGGGTCTG